MSRTPSQSSFYSCGGEDDEPNEDVDNLGDDDEEYTWQTPTAVVHNILFGHIWCEFQGEINLRHTQSDRRAVLTMKSLSWFSTQTTREAEMFKFNGFILDGTHMFLFCLSFMLMSLSVSANYINNQICRFLTQICSILLSENMFYILYYLGDDKVGAFHGNYGHCYYAIDEINDIESITKTNCSAGGHNCIHISSNVSSVLPCNVILTPSSRLIWYRDLSSMTNEEIESRSQYYYFTIFTMCLNEQILSSSFLLPQTDCRYRKDIRFLEQGDLDAAAAEKHRLEEQQRAEAKTRQCEYQPFWFKLDENNEYVYTGEYQKRNFEHCPNLFSQESLL